VRGIGVTTQEIKRDTFGAMPIPEPGHLDDILATAGDLSIVLTDGGKVMSVSADQENPVFRRLDHWIGRDIREVLTVESVPKLDAQLEALESGDATGGRMELNHKTGSDGSFAVRYTIHRFGDPGTYLMIGHDLGAIAEIQQQLVNAQIALERDYEQRRETDTRFRVVLEYGSVPSIIVETESGLITDSNTDAATLFGAAQQGVGGDPISDHLVAPDGSSVLKRLVDATAGGKERAEVKLALTSDNREVTASVVHFRAASERLFLVSFVDGLKTVEAEDDLDGLKELFEKGPEGIVVTTSEGRILKANETFLNLVEAPDASAVLGTSLHKFLSRGRVDYGVLARHATETGFMRHYATNLTTIFGGRLSAELSATSVGDDEGSIIFVIRDVNRAEKNSSIDMNDENARNVMALVGTSTLKEIVAETTDVIERMCIETAVDLTRNNRVAAAEMLGLSRQSLYVRLRKFGLLKRDETE